MNLLGMKRKLLPYGMALGGAGGSGSALGAMSAASPSPSSGGKSAPLAQNSYSPSFGGQSAAPTSAAPPSGGKSSGLGQSGYGMPIQDQMLRQQPGGMPISGTGGELFGGSQGQMPAQGGKSSGLGQGGYGAAPGFDGMPTQNGFNQGLNQAANPNMGSGLRGFNGTFSPEALAFQQANPQPQQPTAQMEDMVKMMSTGSDRGTDPAIANQMMSQLSGMRENFMRNPPQQMSSEQFRQSGGFNQPSQFGRFNQQSNFSPLDMTQDAQRQRQMQQQPSFGGQMGAAATQRQMQGGFGPQAPTQDAFNGFRAMTGSPMNFDQFAQSRGSKLTQQPQQQFNPFQQQFGGFQQQQQQFQQPQISGLQGLFNQMMGQFQQQQRPQQMPRFQSQALQYRPNMQNAQAALSRVQPSVQKQDQDAQAARIAELEAQIAGFQTPTNSSDGGGG